MLGLFYVMVYMVYVYEVQIQINAEQPLSLRLTSSFGIVWWVCPIYIMPLFKFFWLVYKLISF